MKFFRFVHVVDVTSQHKCRNLSVISYIQPRFKQLKYT